MIETVTIITVCMLLLVYFRPGTTPQSTAPLVIERTGKYRMTLAPQLNLAQPFIEAIAKRIAATGHAAGDKATCIFEVRDKRVVPKGFDRYELTISQVNGMLYFEARTPLTDAQGVADDDQGSAHDLIDIVQDVASTLGVNIKLRQETGNK